MNQKGYITLLEVLIIFVVILTCTVVPISCNQEIKHKQKIIRQFGTEMKYWDIFWTSPQIIITDSKITVEEDI